MYKSQRMINSMMLHSFEDIAGSSKNMLARDFCRSWFSTMVSFRYVLVFLNYFVFAL